MTQLLTVAEARREYLPSLSEARIYALAREGILPKGVVVRLGRKVLINESALVDFFASGGADLPGGWRSEADGG